jgi:hypothetical protein
MRVNPCDKLARFKLARLQTQHDTTLDNIEHAGLLSVVHNRVAQQGTTQGSSRKRHCTAQYMHGSIVFLRTERCSEEQ